MNYEEIRNELTYYAHRCYEKNLLVAGEGNISYRLDNGNVLITPTGCCLGEIKPEEFVEVTIDEEAVDPTAPRCSSETKMHLEIYKRRPDVRAVCHCHPRNALAYAICHKTLPWKTHPEVVAYIGEIPTIPYGRPSSQELAVTCAEYMPKGIYGALMENHGSITVGSNLKDAYRRSEVLESFTYTILMSERVGTPVEIPQHDIDMIKVK